MQSANGGHDSRYLPTSMDYTGLSGMAMHPANTHHHHHHQSSHPGLGPGLHYAMGHPVSVGSNPHQLSSSSAGGNVSSDDEGSMDVKPSLSERAGTGRGAPLKSGAEGPPTGKKTKGRVKIKMEFIDNKLRRYTTFSKRKTGIMKKAYELSTLTGTQVMLLVASETGHVYTFATRKLQPMITSDAGKALIQTCLNSPDPPPSVVSGANDQRMSVSGYEETELTYNVAHEAADAAAAAAAHHEKVGENESVVDENDEDEEEEIEVPLEPRLVNRPTPPLQKQTYPPTQKDPNVPKAATILSQALPPEVIKQLLATGRVITETGQAVNLYQPSTSQAAASSSSAYDLLPPPLITITTKESTNPTMSPSPSTSGVPPAKQRRK